MYQEVIHRLLDAESDILDDTSRNANHQLGEGGGDPYANLMMMLSNNTNGGASISNQINATGSMGFSSSAQAELMPLLKEDDAFDIFVNNLTQPSLSPLSPLSPSPPTTLTNSSAGSDIHAKHANLLIKRSFRTMNLLVNDANSAAQMHERIATQQKQQPYNISINIQDEEAVYDKFLISPTRAVVLARKIFASYYSTYVSFHKARELEKKHHQEQNEDGGQSQNGNHGLKSLGLSIGCATDTTTATTTATTTTATTTSPTSPTSPTTASSTTTTTIGTTTNNTNLPTKPHLPHLNKLLSALLAAYPKQVILASFSSATNMSQTLEPMLKLQQYIPTDYSSPIHVLVDIITMGCTGRKRQSSLQQLQQEQQQAMMNGNDISHLNPVYIGCGHRKKFVRNLSSWGIVKQFVHVICHYDDAAEPTCDALLTIMEFICFPQKLHPGLAMSQMNDSNNLNKDKKEESAEEEKIFTSISHDAVLMELAKGAHYSVKLNSKNGDVNDDNHSNDDDDDDDDDDAVYCELKDCSASVSSKALLGIFEIVTGKVRKSDMIPMNDIEEVDDDSIECTAQKEAAPKEIPGIDDNKFLKAGITKLLHSAFVSKIGLIVQAMDINFATASSSSSSMVNDDGKNEKSEDLSISVHAVSHPGRYTIERPFTSRRLDLITLFTDIICYEEFNDDQVNLSAAISALDAVMGLPLKLPQDEVSNVLILNPWPALCDLLFDYPENSMYGVQFYKMLHGICMTNHEKTLKIVVQKCKFLSRAIKECKKQSSGSTRGVLIKCLNALRLHSMSIPPHSFLRHYLDSHDGWKEFEDQLIT